MAKKVCSITRKDFLAKAPASMTVDFAGQKLMAVRKEFSTKSFGYYANGKVMVEIDGKPVEMQVGGNFTVVGSKEQKD